MKKTLTITLVIIMVLLISGCIKKNELTDGEKFKEEYEVYNGKTNEDNTYLTLNIKKDNIIKYSNLKEVNQILDNGTGVIYLGFPKCPWCRNAVKEILDASSSTSLDKIYYVNMQNERDTMKLDANGNIVTTSKASDEYYKLVDKLKDILDDYIIYDTNNNKHNTGEKRIYVPLVLFVRDGELVGYHKNTVDSQTDPYIELNEEQSKELYNIYQTNIHKVLKDMCDDKC